MNLKIPSKQAADQPAEWPTNQTSDRTINCGSGRKWGEMKPATMILQDRGKCQHSQADIKVEIVMQNIIIFLKNTGTTEGGEMTHLI